MSWADYLGISSCIGSPSSEIIFNWFFPPICESVKDFCLFFLSSDKAHTLNYFGKDDDEGYDININ